MSRPHTCVALAAVIMLTGGAAAETVTVTVTGTVVGNNVPEPPLSTVGNGEGATMSFTVDSANFVEGQPGDTRGYIIDGDTFTLSFSGGVTLGLEPSGNTPYFTLVEGFPMADGFFVSTSPFSPGGVPLAQTPYNANVDLGYGPATLETLEILDAIGTYDMNGLTRSSFSVWRGFPDNELLIVDFTELTIEASAGCPADLDMSGAVDFGDILAILSAWGNLGGPEDLNASGTVDFGDLLVVLAEWGPCP